MFSQTVSAEEHQCIMALRGTMTAKAAGRQVGRDDSTVLRVWKSRPGYEPFVRFIPNQLSARQAVICEMFHAAGAAGILLSDMVAQLNALGWVSHCDGIQASFTAINHKFTGQESAKRIKRLSRLNGPCRYALVAIAAPTPEPEPEPVIAEADWAPSIPSIPSRIKTESGARISVARVTWLDGALHA